MRDRFGLISIAVVMLLFVATAAKAVQPDEVLADPALESRARGLSAEIRCMVCQNQSIDDSDAPLARDLRLLVREKLVEGYSDDQVIEHLVARYGEFVLLRPRFHPGTLLLWLTPLLALMIGLVFLFARMQQKRTDEPGGELSEEEKKKLTNILKASDRR